MLRSFFCFLRVVSASAALCLGLVDAYAQDNQAMPSRIWRKYGDDLETAILNHQRGALSSSQLSLVRSSLQRYRVAVVRASELGVRRASVKTMCRAAHGVACINANFFDESGSALGLVISRGILQRQMHRGGNTLTGIFQVTRGGLAIINRSSFDPSAVLEAVQAGPRLIADGVAVRGLSDTRSSRRAGVCLDKSARIIFFITSSGFGGLTVEELQSLLSKAEVGCYQALNLDGGGSAQLYVSRTAPGTVQDAEDILISGRDDVPVALALVPRDIE